MVSSDTEVLIYRETHLAIPTEDTRSNIVIWYHHYLQQLGGNRLEKNHGWYYVVTQKATRHEEACENLGTLSVRKTSQTYIWTLTA